MGIVKNCLIKKKKKGKYKFKRERPFNVISRNLELLSRSLNDFEMWMIIEVAKGLLN